MEGFPSWSRRPSVDLIQPSDDFLRNTGIVASMSNKEEVFRHVGRQCRNISEVAQFAWYEPVTNYTSEDGWDRHGTPNYARTHAALSALLHKAMKPFGYERKRRCS